MSEQAQTTQHKPQLNYWIIFGVGGLLLLIMMVGSFGSTYKNGGNNPLGAQAANPINAQDPATKDFLDSLKAFTDPQQVLTNTQSLQPLKTSLASIISGEGAYKKYASNQQIVELSKKMQIEINTIIASPQSDAAKKAATSFITDLSSLESLMNGEIPQTGLTQPPTGGFAYPLRLSDMTGTFSRTPHGASGSGHGPLLVSGGRMDNAFDLGLTGPNIQSSADINAHKYNPIFAPFTGIVAATGWVHSHHRDGKYVVIKSPDKKYVAALLHLNEDNLIQKGVTVQVGTQIGTLFPLTNSTPHLHFELWVNGNAITTNEHVKSLVNKSMWENQLRAMGLTGS